MIDKIKLKQIIEELREMARDTGLQVTDDVMFTKSVEYLVHTQITYAKSGNPEVDPNIVTDKQKRFLEVNGFEGDFSSLTKKEATQLIKEIIENSNKR